MSNNESQQPQAFLSESPYSGSTSHNAEDHWRQSRDEFKSGFALLLTGILGSALGLAGLAILTLPLFIDPLHEEFGWTRSQIGAAFSVVTVTIFLFGPVVGRLADRIGGRPIMLTSIVLFAIGMSVISQVSGSIWWFYAGYFAVGLGGAGTTYVCYSRALNVRFNASRGLALALMMTGPGMMAGVGPLVLPDLIAEHGWRSAWLMMSVAALIPLPFVFLFVRDSEQGVTKKIAPAPGIPFKSVLRTRQFWLMISATFMLTLACSGTHIHFIGILGEMGLSKMEAAGLASVLGFSMVGGRIACGFLLDLVFAPIVGFMITTIAAVGMLLAAEGGSTVWLAAIAIGVVMGTEADFMAYVSSRYFGLKAYAEIFGWVFGCMALGAASSPLWLGWLHGHTGSYRAGLFVSAGILVCAALCIASLGRYPKSFEKDQG